MSRYWLLSLRLAALLAVAVSCALVLHYLAPVGSGFCGPESGCETVRKSALASFGFPGLLPSVGVAGYVAIFWITFTPALRRWLTPMALVGAGVSLALFLYQALFLHAFCWMCVAADGLGVLVGMAALLLHRRDPSLSAQWDALTGWGWLMLLALSVNAPTVWPKVRASEPLPTAIQELQTPGVLTVVEFVDFECPHCRRQHPVLSAELAGLKQPSRIVRYQVPLAFHLEANAAARAALCAAQFERGEAMANRLFAGELGPQALSAYAADLGIPDAAFATCLDAIGTWEALAEHRKLFNSLKKPILPLTYVGGELLEGYAEPPVVAQAFRKALRPSFTRLSPYAFGAALLLAGGAIFALGRRRLSA